MTSPSARSPRCRARGVRGRSGPALARTSTGMAHPLSIPESMTMDSVSTDPNAASFDAVADDVFSRIASRYDLLCDLFSFGIHRIWKRRMARRIAAARWDSMLDVAAGTGDIALRVIRQLDGATTRSCIVSDICPAMLDIARRRAGRLAGALQFRVFDAH